MRTRYRFSHRANGIYYWTARVPWSSGHEEVITCPVDWFWSHR